MVKYCEDCGAPFESANNRGIYCDECRNLSQSKRRGVFVGGYLPPALKAYLQQRARDEGRTVTQVLTAVIAEAMNR